jgi:hypothetical protein
MAADRAGSIDEIDFVYVRDCLREVQKLLGYPTAKIAAQQLVPAGERGDKYQAALNWIRRHPIDRKLQPNIISAALTLLNNRRQDVSDYLKIHNPQLGERFDAVVAKYLKGSVALADADTVASPQRAYADTIFENWKIPYHQGPKILMPGIYQIFRRYKPTKPPASISGARKATYDWAQVPDHHIICELICFDSVNMEAVLITSERRKYFGSLFIDHERVLFGLLQRKNANKEGINHRVFAAALHNRRYPFYSAIMLKVGDTTSRPIASDCLVVMIPRKHKELYEEFAKEQLKEGLVPKESIITDYLTATPPSEPSHPNWKHIRRVRDFPKWSSLTRPSKEHLPILREPLRTLHHLTIEDLARKGTLIEIFNQKDAPVRKLEMGPKSTRKRKGRNKRH